jgi:hypothetical protein
METAPPFIRIIEGLAPAFLHQEIWAAGTEKRWYFGNQSVGDAPSLGGRPHTDDSRERCMTPHAGRDPSSHCPGLRVTVAFKLEPADGTKKAT